MSAVLVTLDGLLDEIFRESCPVCGERHADACDEDES